MSDLHKNIRKRRKELGLTQDELAKLTGYTNKSSIATIEAGRANIPHEKIFVFADALQTTPSELFGYSTEPIVLDVEPETEEEKDLRQRIDILSYMFKTMPENYRQLAFNSMEQTYKLYLSTITKEQIIKDLEDSEDENPYD